MSDYEFLCVNSFLGTELDARAIKTAFELGVLDNLEAAGPLSMTDLAAAADLQSNTMQLLVGMLEGNGVVARTGDLVTLTPGFKAALQFSDLMQARIAFADLVWPDVHNLFTELLTDLPQFMALSKVFDLFRYDRCKEITPQNLQMTGMWTHFTTCLTKYESAAALDAIDLNSITDFVDLGGNTGEFARQVCMRNPAVKATVVDLPVVCALGRDHIAANADDATAARITFFPADMLSEPLPAAADLVAFKSVLHDWPDAEAEQLLERALTLVRPGGRLLIFERAPIEVTGKRLPYVMAPDLVFLHFFRPADLYLSKLKTLGFVSIDYRRIQLDIGFHLIVAHRPQ
jgi:SAM-dependent methyltransferase